MNIPSDTVVSPSSLPIQSPPLKRRLLCMVYEAMLLFGVLFIAGWLFSTLFQQRHALVLRQGMLAWQFTVLCMYFSWFWSHGGQTLAMKTWRIRVVSAKGLPLSFWHAALRYVCAWGWFLPGLAIAGAIGAQGWMLVIIPAINMLLWALASYADSDRQFLHDRLARTRLIESPGR